MNADELSIRDTIDAWQLATKDGDIDTVLGLMTDDATFLTPGRPPMSKLDFAATFRTFAGKVQFESHQEIREIYTAGDFGYCWSELSISMSSPEDREPTRRAGHVLTVFRRTPDGRWLLHRDANLLMSVAPD